MRPMSMAHVWGGILGGFLAVVSPGECRAGGNMFPVDAGYDLFQTVASGTEFDGIFFQGVPLGTYVFGNAPAVPVGTTDTIIQRLQDVTAAGGTTNLNVLAIQLESVSPVNGQYLFITLDQQQQTIWQSDPTHNLMTIGANTFSTSFFEVFFDIHLGSLNGTIIGSSSVDLSSTNDPWTNNAPSGAELITGVNYKLNGSNEDADFWPGPGLHNGPHEVNPASTPEPSTLAMAATAGLVGLVVGWLKRRRAAD
jgi:hypothetical protein